MAAQSTANTERSRVLIRQGIAVFALLGLVNLWVLHSFVPRWLTPRYRDPFPLLSDHTRGSDMAILFALLPAPATDGRLRVALIGDSAVGGAPPPTDFLPWMLERELETRFPGRRVEVIDLSIIGLRVQEALLLMAKVYGSRPDLVVYAMSPRIAPDTLLWATSVRDLAFDWDILSRIGPVQLWPFLDVDSLPRTMVRSWWPLLRLRAPLARAVVDASANAPAGIRAVTRSLLTPPAPPQQPPDPAGHDTERWMWSRDKYRLLPSAPSTQAIDGIIDLCASEGRCLLYHIPINPGAVRGFEDGLVDEFAEHMRARAAASGVPFRDFRSFGRPENYRTNLAGNPDAIHPTKAGQQAFAPVLAEAVTQLVR